MRIAILALGFPYLSESFTTREAVALRDLGHEVRFFTRQDPTPDNVGAMPDGFTVEPWAAGLVKAFAPDVLYAGGIGYPVHEQTLRMARMLSIPFALRIWSGMDTFTYPAPSFYSQAVSDALCLGGIVEDEFMFRWAGEKMFMPANKLFIVPNSLDLSVYLPSKPETPPLVLAVGRFVEKKGFIHLARVAAEMPNTHFTFIGTGPTWDSCVDAVKLRQVWHGAEFIGNVPLSDLPDWYARAACLVAPSIRTARNDMDGIATVVLEAMAAGCPVITSDLASATHYVIDYVTGLLVPPGDEQALEVAIQFILNNPAEAAEMGRNAREWAGEHLNITTNIVDIEDVLQWAVTP